NSNASTCLIYRGEFAVVPGRNEMYVWVVDVQPDSNGNPVPADEGIWRSTNGGASWIQIPDSGITNCGDSAFGSNSGCGVEQGWYNLELAAIPNPPPPSTGTDLYAGAINLYKCTLTSGSSSCTQGDWINLTHVYGCSPLAAPAHVHPDQHGIAFTIASGKTPGYFAHDGGISRTLDGYAGLNTGSCAGTNQFDSLSETLGSMTEFVSFSVHPTSADILLGGTQDNGSPKTSSATSNSTWQDALGGDGGFTASIPRTPASGLRRIPTSRFRSVSWERRVMTLDSSRSSARPIWGETRALSILPTFSTRRRLMNCWWEPAGCGGSAPAEPRRCNSAMTLTRWERACARATRSTWSTRWRQAVPRTRTTIRRWCMR